MLTAVLRRWEILLESLGDMEKVRTFVAEIMVDLQQPYKIRHHPNDVFSFTHNLTEGWHIVTPRGLSQQPLSNRSLRCIIYNLMTKRTDCLEVRVTVKMVYPVLIKVRAYTRVRFGKVEKVRSHYRRYWGI